jgi:hypothetical protein
MVVAQGRIAVARRSTAAHRHVAVQRTSGRTWCNFQAIGHFYPPLGQWGHVWGVDMGANTLGYKYAIKSRLFGGRGEIRTHGTLAGTPVFKTGALNHSATLPCCNFRRLANRLLLIPSWHPFGTEPVAICTTDVLIRLAALSVFNPKCRKQNFEVSYPL